MAGVAQSHIHGRFAWQAPHSWHCVTPLHVVARDARDARDAAALCVAGVGLGDIHLDFTWQATSTVVLRGRRLTHGTG